MTDAALAPTPDSGLDPAKFQDPDITAKGERRASVGLVALHTLWFNTGSLCNLTCRNCYIESSPTNDRLAYLTVAEVEGYLDEAGREYPETGEIGFTGGEPFMNPDIVAMLDASLGRGYRVLVLTNAMRPMLKLAGPLLDLRRRHGDRLTIRVSVDHYGRSLHEIERGEHSWRRMREGLEWLARNGFRLAIAGRTCWGEAEDDMRHGYARLFDELGLALDAFDPEAMVLFPEMDETADVPEITDKCWDILGVEPQDVMCATSRMVVKRRGADSPVVLPCTLLPYDRQFELGSGLADAGRAVKLNHPHCARFCVLGGGSCSKA